MSQTFQTLGVSAPLVRALAKHEITTPFAIQELVVPDALAGRDILAQSPTGSGKTLAFGLPLVERATNGGRKPSALVLVPTRELATQVAADIQPLAAAKGLRVCAVYGGKSVDSQARRAREAHILIATPGRLNDLLERKLISLEGVRALVLDEADRMLDMGFQPQVDRILRTVPSARQTMLFSATLEGAVGALADRYTNDPARFRAELPVERQSGDIEHEFVAVTHDKKLDRLIEQLEADRGLALVFVRTKHGADKLAKKLARRDIGAVAMHGNLSQNARERALKRFESGHVSTLVATDVAARGLDVDDITHVINFDPPRADEDYVHRVGRTGRAGRSGTGVTFVLPEQQTDVGKLAVRLGHGAAFTASGMRQTATAPPARRRRRGR
ncbi:MAG TPA: DEAD/DEAH box helicase [Gaiellaceae bacterium]|jgi:superfamily II DNA/RNA helicase|nr:DEAD/DEAH box helicase [Gaiellaceae bacterium]